MKQFLNHKYLPALTLLCGGIGMLLRLWLLGTENDKGFIARGHISEILLLVLTALVLVLLLAATRPLLQASKFSFNFPASPVAALGTGMAALGIGIIGVTDLLRAADPLFAAEGLTAILSAAALVWAGRCRWQGKQPSMLLHGAVCLWLMVRLICVYRSWSSDPQLEDYCFQLLAIVCCMLAAYHRASFDANDGHRNQYAFFSLAGLYFCCLSMAGPDSILPYVSLGIWLATDLCDLTPMPRKYWSVEP